MAENFGERMARLKAERGTGTRPGPGRRPIAQKYRPQVQAVERTFAEALPAEAQRYVDELAPKEPERCPDHGRILGCPVKGCQVVSQRVAYNHRAAAYAFDRILGRPTTRAENVLTLRLLEELTAAFTHAFVETNTIADPLARRDAFAGKLRVIGAEFTNGHVGQG